jgi:hypothetical protein
LIDELEKHVRPGGQVVLAGLPDLGRFGTFPQPLRAVLGWQARALDRDLKTIAKRSAGVIYLAMPPVSSPELFAEDRFHPNAAAYHVLAAYFADTLATTKPKKEGDRGVTGKSHDWAGADPLDKSAADLSTRMRRIHAAHAGRTRRGHPALVLPDAGLARAAQW